MSFRIRYPGNETDMRYLLLTVCTLNVILLSAQSQPFTVSLFFDKGAFMLSNGNRMQLEEVHALVKDSSYNAVFIRGFADNDGSDEFNLELSRQRVDAVQSWYYGKKYKAESKCFGEKEAINKNRNEDEKSMNRRVDIVYWTNYQWGSDKKKPQVYTFAPNKIIEFTAAEGTRIKIPANALVYADGETPLGEVKLEITEFYSMADILRNKLTTTSNGQMLESAGMININVSRNEKPLRLKGGATMDVQFAERSANDGFGLFYGQNDPQTGGVNWIPAANPSVIDKEWRISGIKLFMSDTIETWKSKFDYNTYGQRIKVTEHWEETKGIYYDTVILDKTINANKIILQATQLGWINCDQYIDPEKTVDIIVQVDPMIESNVVMIFNDKKSMLAPVKWNGGQLYFKDIPAGENVTITGVGSGEGKLFFASQQLNSVSTTIQLGFEEASIAAIQKSLAEFR